MMFSNKPLRPSQSSSINIKSHKVGLYLLTRYFSQLLALDFILGYEKKSVPKYMNDPCVDLLDEIPTKHVDGYVMLAVRIILQDIAMLK